MINSLFVVFYYEKKTFILGSKISTIIRLNLVENKITVLMELSFKKSKNNENRN